MFAVLEYCYKMMMGSKKIDNSDEGTGKQRIQIKTWVFAGRLRAPLLTAYSEGYAGRKSHGRCANVVDEEGISVLIYDS